MTPDLRSVFTPQTLRRHLRVAVHIPRVVH